MTILQTGSLTVSLVLDERGESETYEGYSLECRQESRLVWTEGIRKDRTQMRDEWRAPVEAALQTLKDEVQS